MAVTPALTGRLTITVKDINNNSVAKTFNNVNALHFDYVKGMINVVDEIQGSFYFSLATETTLTYTINGTTHTIVTS